jgi:hypothetical protein
MAYYNSGIRLNSPMWWHPQLFDPCCRNPCNCNPCNPCCPPQPIPRFRERGLFTEFQTDEPSTIPNTGSTLNPIILTSAPQIIAQLSLTNGNALQIDDPGDRVWLTGTVGWTATAAPSGFSGNSAKVIFQVWRNMVGGSPIFETIDSSEPNSMQNNLQTTTFTFVDTTPITTPGQQVVQYFLTAQLLDATVSNASIIGPITFTGAEIEPNRFCRP